MGKLRRNVALVGVVCLLAFAQVSAQGLTTRGFGLGVKGGVTFSSFWGDGITELEDVLSPTVEELDEQMYTFFTGGVYMVFNVIPDFFTIQPEIIYTRQGKSWEITGLDGSVSNLHVVSDYINLPLLFKLLIPLDFAVTPSAYLGPQLSFRVKSRAVGVADVVPGAEIGFIGDFDEEDITDNVNFFDVGLATGIGLDIDAGPGTITVDFRYSFNFLDVFDISAAEQIRNSAFAVMLGYTMYY